MIFSVTFSCSGVEEFSWLCRSWCEVTYIIVCRCGESCYSLYLFSLLFSECCSRTVSDCLLREEFNALYTNIDRAMLITYSSNCYLFIVFCFETLSSREEMPILCPNTLGRIQPGAPLNKVCCFLQEWPLFGFKSQSKESHNAFIGWSHINYCFCFILKILSQFFNFQTCAIVAVTQILVVFVKTFNKSREENERLADAEKKKLEKEAMKEKTANNTHSRKDVVR